MYQLAGRREVRAMLHSDEYGRIKEDYDLISRKHFPKVYFQPDGMSFSRSDALFSTGELAVVIREEYERQCEALCYGPVPLWAEVQARFEELRPRL